jgi:hypothetical protein
MISFGCFRIVPEVMLSLGVINPVHLTPAA